MMSQILIDGGRFRPRPRLQQRATQFRQLILSDVKSPPLPFVRIYDKHASMQVGLRQCDMNNVPSFPLRDSLCHFRHGCGRLVKIR